MVTAAEILANYRKLIDYCGRFWERVVCALPGQITCSKGCALCCELPSVNHIEAFLIIDYCAEHPDALLTDDAARQTMPEQNGSCPFITNGSCRIYEVRPLICRTHGLLLRGASFRNPVSISCPYNFTGIDLTTIDNRLVLDIEKISDNLARLNAAFCLLHGDVSKASARFLLRDLASGAVTGIFNNLPQQQT